MDGLKYITITQLFWDTLAKYRNHSRYPEIRAKIAWCVEMKMKDRNFSNNSDTSFLASANKYLVGLWHCKLSTNPDVVMFYTIDGDTMNLAMIGSHHDYPHQGKHVHKAESLNRKVRGSIEGGHVASPRWDKIKWTVPSDIADSFELEETTQPYLMSLLDTLKLEHEDAPIFENVHRYRLDDADIETFTQWLWDTDRALEAVMNAQKRIRAIERERDNSEITSFVTRAPKAVSGPK